MYRIVQSGWQIVLQLGERDSAKKESVLPVARSVSVLPRGGG